MLRGFEKARSQVNVRAGVAPLGDAFGHAVLSRLADDTERLSISSGATPEQLRKIPAATVLPADAYSLQLVEAPKVPDAEIGEALRWKIQHLIEFPVEEAIIETFEMPPPANPGASPMIYAVVARRSEIESHIERIGAADIRIDAIDIPELCVRNIAVRLPQDEYGVAFLHFNDDFGYLTITRGGILYMIRRIELQRDVLAEQLQEIALEIHRSLDYYESQFECPPVSELVLGPGDESDTLSASLAENLGISVSKLDLSAFFALESELSPREQQDCLMAVGAALRDDSGRHRAAA
jgi:MSHA biogenesis protein MshI